MRSSFLIRTALISFLSLLAASPSDLLAQGTLIPVPTRRDMVFDHVGKYLYISTSTTPGRVERYNLATGSLDTPYPLPSPNPTPEVGPLNGIDISADDSFLLVAEDAPRLTQGRFQKINLISNEFTPIPYTRVPGETGAWDVAIDWENRALVTTQHDGTGETPCTPIRQILANNTIHPTPAPGSCEGGLVGRSTQIYRSADRTRFYFLESNVATGPILTYDAIANAFGPHEIANALLNSADGGVNRDGTLLGTRLANGSMSLETAPNFTPVHTFPGIDHGVAFDAVQDIVYGGNSTTDEIIGYDTRTPFAEKFRREIGEDVPDSRDNNCTTLVASPDGRYLALATTSGIRLLPTVVTGTANLANISTRVVVQTGNNILIGGFIIAGTDPRRVCIRAIGPSLINAGVPNPLHDPVLELSDGNGIIGINDDWQSASNVGDIPQALRPSDSHESVILTTLPPGSYTASVRGNGNTTGVGLFEVYDLDSLDTTVHSRLANVSSRGFVQTGGDILIAGIIAQGGDGISQVVVRAIGPSLAASGINNALANPTLELHDGNGELIRSNDNWKSTQQSALEATGLAPSNDLESAILVTLTAGNYTAIVTGFGEPIGVSSPDASLPVNASVTRIQAGDYPSHLGEKQHIHFSSIPIAGSFKLTFPGPGPGVPTGQCVSPIGITAAIPVTATSAEIQAAIDALPVAVYHTGAVHVASWGHYDIVTGTAGDFTIDYHALCAGTAPYDFGGFLNLCSIETIGVQSATGVGLVEIYDLD